MDRRGLAVGGTPSSGGVVPTRADDKAVVEQCGVVFVCVLRLGLAATSSPVSISTVQQVAEGKFAVVMADVLKGGGDGAFPPAEVLLLLTRVVLSVQAAEVDLSIAWLSLI